MTGKELEEILADEFTLDIPNFEKWNPPLKDKKGGVHEHQFRSYVRFSVHFLDDPKLIGLGDSEVMMWQRLVLQRAKRGTPICHLRATNLPTICHRRATRVPPVLLKLANLGLIVLSKERKKERKERMNESEAGIGGGFLPPELTTLEIREIRTRREIPDRGLLLWLSEVPTPKWLATKLKQLDAEAPEIIPFNEKPFTVRFRQYIAKHLEYEKKGQGNEYTAEDLERIRAIEEGS